MLNPFFEDGQVELYDLSQDIGESRNLADEYPDRVREMRGRLAAWLRSVGAAVPEPNPNFIAWPERGTGHH